MDGYLTKPIRPQELDEILEEYVARRTAEAQASEMVKQRK
jgi:YesN/AraC family two-component response regulator